MTLWRIEQADLHCRMTISNSHNSLTDSSWTLSSQVAKSNQRILFAHIVEDGDYGHEKESEDRT